MYIHVLFKLSNKLKYYGMSINLNSFQYFRKHSADHWSFIQISDPGQISIVILIAHSNLLCMSKMHSQAGVKHQKERVVSQFGCETKRVMQGLRLWILHYLKSQLNSNWFKFPIIHLIGQLWLIEPFVVVAGRCGRYQGAWYFIEQRMQCRRVKHTL
jgi:hypothetical protein